MGPQGAKGPAAGRALHRGCRPSEPGWDGPGGTLAGGGARSQGFGSGPQRLTPSLTHPRLLTELDRPDHRVEGKLGPERPHEDHLVGEGAGARGAAVGELGPGEEARSSGAAGQSGPGRTAEHTTPPPPQMETSGNLPAHLFPDACAALTSWAGGGGMRGRIAQAQC